MPTILEFRDCPNCGKSIPYAAKECYRCRIAVTPLTPKPKIVGSYPIDDPSLDSEETRTDHGALAYGGYEPDEDEFDYEEYVDREFNESKNRRRSFQWYVVWFLIVAISFPMVAMVIQLVFGG